MFNNLLEDRWVYWLKNGSFKGSTVDFSLALNILDNNNNALIVEDLFGLYTFFVFVFLL